MPKAALLIIGSEMLDPQRPDANGPAARAMLGEIGIPVGFLARVPDDEAAITGALRAALACCDVVITSGGLGPTGDDLTREGAAALVGRKVVEDPGWMAVLAERLTSRGRELTSFGRRQAHVVEGAEALPNEHGLACGNWLTTGGRRLVLLPGVPREFRAMLAAHVIPRLADLHPTRPEVRVVRAVAAGIPEQDAETTLHPWYGRPGLDVSILPSMGVLKITFAITSPPAQEPETTERDVRAALAEGLGRHLVSLEGVSLEEEIGRLLLARGWTAAAAESCTGGLVGHRLVSVPGASRYFLGEVVAYHNSAKEALLGVPAGLLERCGAVSEDVALAMARGARARFGASCAVATTGVAGPTGGTPDKPAGTVWTAVVTPQGEWARKIFFPMDRASVMELSANYALFLLWSRVREGA